MSATAIKSHILDNFREMIAASATFQSLVGATGTAAEKLAVGMTRVHEMGADDADEMPRAIIEHFSYESRIVGTNCRIRSGELLASFEFIVPEAESETIQAASQWFENQVGDIAEELMDLARTTRASPNNSETYLDLRSHAMHENAGLIPPEESPQDITGIGRTRMVWGCSYLFRWQG